MSKDDFLLASYMNTVQLTANQLTKSRRIKLMDRYILQFAFVSVLFLLMKIGAEALVEKVLLK